MMVNKQLQWIAHAYQFIGLREIPGPKSWVRYCYGFDLAFKHQTAICNYVWDRYNRRLNGVKLQNRVKKRLLSLVWLAAQDAAAKNRNETYKEYAGASLGRLVGSTLQGWSKHTESSGRG